MKKLLVVVLVPLAVLAAVGAVAYVLLIGPIFAVPVGVAVAESALATDDLILLAGLNVKHMHEWRRALESRYSAIQSIIRCPASRNSFVSLSALRSSARLRRCGR